MATIHLTDASFETEVLQNKGPVIVDFFAPWCGPCKMLAPVIEEVSESYDGKVKVCKVDIDESDEISSKYGVQSVPTLIFFKDGAEIDRSVGFQDFDDLSETIDGLLV